MKRFTGSKMKVDDDNMEPVTNLGLALDYSNQCNQRRLNNGSGAGANAGSRVDMTFVAGDPLSELVWSPRKGLSVKCAECGLAQEIPSLLGGAGLTSVTLQPSQGITSRRVNIYEPTDEINVASSHATFHVKGEVSGSATLSNSPGSNSGIMPVCKSGPELNTGLEHGRMVASSLEMDEPKPDTAQVERVCVDFKCVDFNNAISSDSTGGRGDVGDGNQTLGIEVLLPSDVHTKKECMSPSTPLLNSTSPNQIDEGLALVIKEENRSIMKSPGSTSFHLEKLESMDENDLHALNSVNACVAHEVKNISQQDKDAFPENEGPVEHSPAYRKIHMYHGKGKGKASSHGEVSGTKSEEDESHESVESCNSARLYSTGKKQWSFEQQLINGSKRVKRQIQETPGSTSFIRQDSSFMNWISNMTNGFSKSNLDEAPSLTLTTSHPNHGHGRHDQKLVSCNNNQDPGYRNMGFQTIFQSIYRPNTKVRDTQTLNVEYQTHEGSNELELVEQVCDVNVTPIACSGVNDNIWKRYLPSNEKRDQTTSGNGAGTSFQPKIMYRNIASSQENMTISARNKSSCDLESGREKSEVSPSSSSLGKRKINSAENNDFNLPYEGKETNNFVCKSGSLGSLWITRFSPKTSSPMLNLDHCNQSTGGTLDCSAESTRLIPHSQNLVSSSKDLKHLEVMESPAEDTLNIPFREWSNRAANPEASFGFRRFKGHNDQQLVDKSSPIPSHRFKSPEAMASIFARRLDALKNITPSDVTDNAARAITTCFFCGIRGHNIQACSEIKKNELGDLLRNINSYSGAEDFPWLCIRCFQPNHWAIACPNVSSRRWNQLECDSSMVNLFGSGKRKLEVGDERNPKSLKNKKFEDEITGSHTVWDGNIPPTDTDLKLNLELNGLFTSDNAISNSIPVKNHIALGSRENESKEIQITRLCKFVNQQISDVPKGLFDAIKKLRLSRADILKWMNSCISISHLEGFFLRLRLGKWEEGLGGTGYYVACITGAEKEKSQQSSKYPICANIGGIKCLVESQYVSNQDFVEDELMVWWCATLKSGGKIPSEEDLKIKLEVRKKLDF